MSDGDVLQLLREHPDWVDHIDAGALTRGRAYAAQGHSRTLSLHGNTAEAICQGSGGQRYHQTIHLILNGADLRVFGKCSCPVGINCKHCMAALFHLLDNASDLQAPLPQEQAALSLPPDLDQWVEALEAPALPTAHREPVRKGPAIYFRIQSDHEHYRLEAVKGTRQADGNLKFSRVTALPELIYYTPRYVTEDDVRLLRLIDTCSRGHSPW